MQEYNFQKYSLVFCKPVLSKVRFEGDDANKLLISLNRQGFLKTHYYLVNKFANKVNALRGSPQSLAYHKFCITTNQICFKMTVPENNPWTLYCI